MSQFSLLSERRFAPFFWTQFLGAFNDSFFKIAVITVLTFQASSWTTISPSLLNNLIPGLFILPFVLFSATAGQVADRFDKAKLARLVKAFEIFIMLVAAVGWVTHSLGLLLTTIVGMGLHSTLFGPLKYAYLPQHLKSSELTGGNGLIESGTFVGILAGEIMGAVIVHQDGWGLHAIAIGAIVVAAIGWVAASRIPDSPANDPSLLISRNPVAETWRNLLFSAKNRTVFLSMLGNSWFWFYGSILLAQFPLYAKDWLHGNHEVFVLLMTVFSLGVGAGSLLCEKLSGHKIEIGLVPFGAFGLTVFGIDLYLASVAYTNVHTVGVAQFVYLHSSVRILLDCMLIGLFGGLYIVPLFALIQTRCAPGHTARTIAGMNVLNAVFMLVAAGMGMALLSAGLTIPELFLVTAILNGLVAIYIFSLVPEFLIRFLAWLLIHTIHSVEVVNGDSIPDEGAAVLVCNHVSYVDAIVIAAACPRPVRFVMDHSIFKIPVLSWLFRTMRAIPIAPAKENEIVMLAAYDAVAQALAEGDLVCIFPEGRLTKTGDMSDFRGGIKKILDRTPAPVIPMALRGLWGSMLTRGEGNPFERGWRRGIRSSLSLVVGDVVPAIEATPEYLQERVASLRGDHR
jgi:1-acyl-sn-glycerol-3-phosphate acyltransferase